MAKLCDNIEKFILDNFTGSYLDISRNDLAEFFSCVPSQINYVLSTRFNSAHGYIIKSQRGGGGYIRIEKIDLGKNEYINNILSCLGDELCYHDFCGIVSKLVDLNVISIEQQKILDSVCSKNSLSSPFRIEDKMRAKIVKNLLLDLIRREDHVM